jgi:hypothetical protein
MMVPKYLIFQKHGSLRDYIFFKTLSSWVGTGERRREIRMPAPVNLDVFLNICFRFKYHVSEIKTCDSLQNWMMKREPSTEEWVYVETELVSEHMPNLLSERACLTSPYGLYYDSRHPGSERKRAATRNYSKVLRREVLSRDKSACVLCGKRLRYKEATMDHIIPYGAGGESTLVNLVTMCKDCNQSKGMDRRPELLNLTIKFPGVDPDILEKKAFQIIMDKGLMRKAYEWSGNLMCGFLEIKPQLIDEKT